MNGTRHVRWRSLQHDGVEQLEMRTTDDEIVVRSAIVSQSERAPVGFFYEMTLGHDWRFRELMMRATTGQELTLGCANGVWRVNGLARPELSGCIDIDFQATPFTNTLPIRRAPITIGQSARFAMAYIPIDTLEPIVDEQIYTRLAEHRYRYEAADGSFTAELTVDEVGLVRGYPPLFTRAPTSFE